MRVMTIGGLFFSLLPSLAAAQSWGGATQGDPLPPSLLAPSDAPSTTNSQVGAAPGLINPNGALHGDADTSRYDSTFPVAPVQTPEQYTPGEPPPPDHDGGPPRP